MSAALQLMNTHPTDSPQSHPPEASGVYRIVPDALLNMDFKPNADGVLTLRIFNPARGNALNTEMVKQLRTAFQAAEHNDDIKVVVLRGLEERPEVDIDKKGNLSNVFGSGMDLKEVIGILEKHSHDDQKSKKIEAIQNHCRQFAELFDCMARFEKPIVGVTCGPAVGMGATLLVLCDRIFSTNNATIAYPEKQLGKNAGSPGQLEPIISAPYLLNSGIDDQRAMNCLISGQQLAVDALGKVNVDDDLEGVENQLKQYLNAHTTGRETIQKRPPHAAALVSESGWGVRLPPSEANFQNKVMALAGLQRIGETTTVTELSTELLAEQICDIGIKGLENMLKKGKNTSASPEHDNPGNNVILTGVGIKPKPLPDH